MESKYKEKAKEMLESKYGKIDFSDNKGAINGLFWSALIDEMCQLAEEVENTPNTKWFIEGLLAVKFYKGETLPTKILNYINNLVNDLMPENNNCNFRNIYTIEQVEDLLKKQRQLCWNKARFNDSSSENRDNILNAKLEI